MEVERTEIDPTPSLKKDIRKNGYPFTVDEFKVISESLRNHYYRKRPEGIWLNKLKKWN